MLLFVFGKNFAEVCLKMQLSNIIHLHPSVSEYVTTNVTVKPVSQRFCAKQITAVLRSLTSLFQDSDLFCSKPH